MGIKIVLTESQVATLEQKVGPVVIAEANLACTDLNYHSLLRFLNGREEKKLGNNTWVIKTEDYWLNTSIDAVGVKYHNTVILKINSEGVVTIKNGGFETVTTKDRLNQFLRCLGYNIYQKNYIWYIANDNRKLEFVDGMQILPNGQLTPPVGYEATKKVADAVKSLDIDPKYYELYGVN